MTASPCAPSRPSAQSGLASKGGSMPASASSLRACSLVHPAHSGHPGIRILQKACSSKDRMGMQTALPTPVQPNATLWAHGKLALESSMHTLWDGDLLRRAYSHPLALRSLQSTSTSFDKTLMLHQLEETAAVLKLKLVSRHHPGCLTDRHMSLSKGASMLNRDMIGRILSKESTMRMWGCSLLYSASSSSHSVTEHSTTSAPCMELLWLGKGQYDGVQQTLDNKWRDTVSFALRYKMKDASALERRGVPFRLILCRRISKGPCSFRGLPIWIGLISIPPCAAVSISLGPKCFLACHSRHKVWWAFSAIDTLDYNLIDCHKINIASRLHCDIDIIFGNSLIKRDMLFCCFQCVFITPFPMGMHSNQREHVESQANTSRRTAFNGSSRFADLPSGGEIP